MSNGRLKSVLAFCFALAGPLTVGGGDQGFAASNAADWSLLKEVQGELKVR